MKSKKILIVCLDNLGDTVMATSVLQPISQIFPEYSLGMWVKNYTKDLFDLYPALDIIHSCDPFWGRSPGTPSGSITDFGNCLREIKKINYDIAVVLNAEWRRAMSCLILGIKERIGFDQRKSRFFLTHSVIKPQHNTHTTLAHKQLIEGWRGTSYSSYPFLPVLGVASHELAWAKDFIQKHNLNDKTKIFIHPFSGDAKKNWPLKNWNSLIMRFNQHARDYFFLIVTSPSEKKQLSNMDFKQENCLVLEDVGLSKIKSLYKLSQLHIGGDSGPAHMAAALGVATVCLFGPTNPELYAPRGLAPVIIIKESRIGDITVEQVFRQTLRYLSNDKTPAPHQQSQ